MSVALRLLINTTLKEGVSVTSLGEFMGRASAAVAAKEPGTTVYNWWRGEDGAVIFEDGYRDEAAFGIHMANMTDSGMLGEWMSLVDVTTVQALGEVSDATRGMLAGLGAVHYAKGA